MRQKVEVLTDAERDALLYVRELHEELENMCDGLRELKLLSISISSPNMDGMPKAQSDGDAYAQVLVRIERQERDIASLSKRVSKAQYPARRAANRLKGPFKRFCEDYYVNGMPFSLASAASGVTDRQCKNYMAFIQKKASP